MARNYELLPLNDGLIPVIRVTKGVVEKHGFAILEDTELVGPPGAAKMEVRCKIYVHRSKEPLLVKLTREGSEFILIRNRECDPWAIFQMNGSAKGAIERLETFL